MKKTLGCLLLIMLLVVAGCSFGGNHKLSSKKSEESKQETVKKESEEEKDPDLEKYEEIEKKMKGIKDAPFLDKLDPLMTEKSFTNSKGIRGWKDYKELMGKVELADYRFTKDSKGSSIKDVDAFFKGKKGIKRKVIETHDDVKQVDYWYVDPDGKKIGNSNTPVFYAEIMTKYKDGKLVYASVEPGSYVIHKDDAIKYDDYSKLKKLSQLTKLDHPKPVPYSVAQIKSFGVPLTSVSFMTHGSKDTKDEVLPALAYFTFSPKNYEDKSNPDPKVLNLVHMDFLNASSDFGNAHFVVLSKYIKEYESNYETASDDSLK
ncbi:TPA: hypothetical protein OYE19_000257 [Staphylococcus aureus]|nr:hypothetical protein [Staphylococcus aureus]HCW7511565.1 hypothetical protein [Staphylococcus aureus]